MAQLEALKREVNYLKNCIYTQQGKSNHLEWELLELESRFLKCKESLDRDLWKVIDEVESLKEDFYYQQDYLCDLDGRINYRFETEKKVDHLEVKIDALYENIKRVVLIFSKKCSTLFKITPRVNAKAQPGNPDIELLID